MNRVALLAAAWASIMAARAAAEEVSDVARHYRFTIPAGWKAMTDEELQPMREMAKNSPQAGQFERGYIGQAEGFFGVAPYLIVQVQTPAPKGTYEDIERGIAKGVKEGAEQSKKNLPKEMQGMADNVKFGVPRLERDKNRFVVEFNMDAGLLGKTRAVSYTMLGRESAVSLHFYVPEKDFAKHSPEFAKLADSFRWDEGFEFKPGRFGGVLDGALKGGMKGAVIGALVAGAVGLLVTVFRKRKPQSADLQEDDGRLYGGGPLPGAGPPAPSPPPDERGRDDVYRL
ncbi:MAG TPA: hypothetical protein VNC50_11310 [Planctomycetia bacterium]|nr:hypothetical protein [Planctomycetia bacterium]